MEKTEIKNLVRLSLSEGKGGMENVVFIIWHKLVLGEYEQWSETKSRPLPSKLRGY
jgi:hypothetical protein